jgi:hypothetical protein
MTTVSQLADIGAAFAAFAALLPVRNALVIVSMLHWAS